MNPWDGFPGLSREQLAAAEVAVDQLKKADAAIDQMRAATAGLAVKDIHTAAEKFNTHSDAVSDTLSAAVRPYDPIGGLAQTAADAIIQQSAMSELMKPSALYPHGPMGDLTLTVPDALSRQSVMSDMTKVAALGPSAHIAELAKTLAADSARQQAAMLDLMKATAEPTLDIAKILAEPAYLQTALSLQSREAAQPTWDFTKTIDDAARSISELAGAAAAYNPYVGILQALEPDSLKAAANALTSLLNVDLTAGQGWMRTLAESPLRSGIYSAIASSVGGLSRIDVFNSGSLAMAMEAVVGDTIISIEQGESEGEDFLAAVRNIVREEISRAAPNQSVAEILYKVMHVILFLITLYVLLCGDPSVNSRFAAVDRELKRLGSAEQNSQHLIEEATEQQIEYVALYRASVRVAPQDSAKIAFSIRAHQIVRFVERSGDWLLVRFINHRDGTEVIGWVQAAKLEQVRK